MKVVRLLLPLLFLVIGGNIIAQEANIKQKVSIDFPDLAMASALRNLEVIAGVNISYAGDLFSKNLQTGRVQFKEKSLQHIISHLLYPQKIALRTSGNRLFIIKLEPKPRRQLSGHINNAETGEILIGATVSAELDQPIGTMANAYGFYSLTLPQGSHSITVSYLGYQAQVIHIDLSESKRLDISLQPLSNELNEVVVVGKNKNNSFEKNQTGYHKLSLGMLKKIPSLVGDPDVIKMVQLLPGVQSVGEGSTGMFVRGGGLDQNLILLDEAPVYNPSHALGFFSVFNTDAINHAEIYKSGFPIEYGGRLSSVIDLRMKEGNKERFGLTGGIGTLSSRLLMEGPIKQDKHSFMLSARRSYPDLFLKLLPDDGGNDIHYYDINAKLNFKLGPNDRLYFSTYLGKDLLRLFDRYENTWGNHTATLRWNHIFNPKFFSNFSLVYSRYHYFIDNLVDQVSTFNWESGIKNYNAKADFSWYISPDLTLRFGLNSIYHKFNPGSEGNGLLPQVPKSQALESAVYVGSEHHLADRWSINYGIRLNLFQNIGPFTQYNFDQNHQLKDSTSHDKGKTFHHFVGLAPRLNIRYLLSDQQSLKFSYSRTYQYQQQLRNSVTGFNAFYIWLPSGPNVADQLADQISLGYSYQTRSQAYQLSLEAYYKKLGNQIDYADHAQLIQNPYLVGDLRRGDGHAYGMEFMANKELGRLKGWLSYTYSRTLRNIPELNDGNTYPAFFDIPHNINLLLQYEASERWALTANWLFRSGNAATLPEGSFRIGDAIVPIYPGRNTSRLPAYHRLDLSAKLFRKNRDQHKNDAYWLFSIYNVYYRKNALSINYGPKREPITGNVPDPTDIVSTKTYIFGLIPSVSYNFKF